MANMTPVHDMSVPNVRMNPLSDVKGNWRQMTMNDGQQVAIRDQDPSQFMKQSESMQTINSAYKRYEGEQKIAVFENGAEISA